VLGLLLREQIIHVLEANYTTTESELEICQIGAGCHRIVREDYSNAIELIL
jgi:hypothetical protein